MTLATILQECQRIERRHSPILSENCTRRTEKYCTLMSLITRSAVEKLSEIVKKGGLEVDFPTFTSI